MSILSQLLNKNETESLKISGETNEEKRIIQKLLAILNTLSSGVFAVEPDGVVFFWSQTISRMTNTPSAQALGKNYRLIIKILPHDGEITSPLFEIIEKKEKQTYEYQMLFAGQSEPSQVEAIYTPLFDENQKIIGVLIEIKDVSLEKKLEQMKLDFVSIVSHELRTPIAAIKGYLDTVLQEANDLSAEHKEFLKRAYFSNERELETIENLLNVSRIEQGVIKVEIEPLRLEDIVSSVTAEWQEAAQGKGLQLKFVFPHFSLPAVLADRDRLREVLTNLISNAIKYSYKGEITVEITQKGKELIVSVSDEGPGISEETKPKLFQKFYRGERSLTEETPGTGLGLYITKSFVELMRGRIWVESKVERGTTFYFSLPITQ